MGKAPQPLKKTKNLLGAREKGFKAPVRAPRKPSIEGGLKPPKKENPLGVGRRPLGESPHTGGASGAQKKKEGILGHPKRARKKYYINPAGLCGGGEHPSSDREAPSIY